MKNLVILFVLYFSIVNAKDAPFFGFAIEGYLIESEQIEELITQSGIDPQIIELFWTWPLIKNQAFPLFPIRSLDLIWKSGAIGCLTWEPMILSDTMTTPILTEEILNGDYDLYLRQCARQIKHWGKPLLIRFAHEMNLSRYHWGEKESDLSPQSPEKYKKMFQYIIQLFDEEKAHNILWVFCPNVESIPQTEWNRLENYYPGNQYIDILAMDGYNWGNLFTKENDGWDSSWQSFHEIFQDTYKQLRSLAPEKPIIICETAAPLEQNKRSQWLKEALHIAQEWNIKALIWFQIKKETDWRLSPSETKNISNLLSKKLPQSWAKEMVDEKRKTHRSS